MAFYRAGQEKDFFLDVGGEDGEVHYLDDAVAGDVTEAGDAGVVTDFTAGGHAVQLDGEGREASDAVEVYADA